MLLLVLICIALAIGSHYWRQRREFFEMRSQISALGGYWNAHGAALDQVHSVYFVHTVTDADLVCLGRFSGLENLYFSMSQSESQITDEGLRHLRSLKQLKHVQFYGTQLTQDGVAQLREHLPEARIKLLKSGPNMTAVSVE